MYPRADNDFQTAESTAPDVSDPGNGLRRTRSSATAGAAHISPGVRQASDTSERRSSEGSSMGAGVVRLCKARLEGSSEGILSAAAAGRARRARESIRRGAKWGGASVQSGREIAAVLDVSKRFGDVSRGGGRFKWRSRGVL